MPKNKTKQNAINNRPSSNKITRRSNNKSSVKVFCVKQQTQNTIIAAHIS